MQYTTIISAAQLIDCLGKAGVVVFDTRFSLADTGYGERVYSEGHIPGAFYLHLDRDLSGPITPSSGRHPLPPIENFVEVMRGHGVSTDSQVIAYDDASGMFAARCWWLLKWMGHERVAVLDGGMQAWLRQGGARETAIPPLPRRGDFIQRMREAMLVEVDELQRGLSERTMLLCDARAPERYRGDVEPIDKVGGHVPGAINLPFAQNLDAQGCFRDPAALAALHSHPASAGTVVHMCGSGVTACHNVLATAVSGQPLPALYAGSWSEWITDPNRPVARGEADPERDHSH
jgi:thiosulfate/3-mercaptopyruvate sulfurtransferase